MHIGQWLAVICYLLCTAVICKVTWSGYLSRKSSWFSVFICDCLTSDQLFCNDKNLGWVSETAAVLIYWWSAAMKSCLSVCLSQWYVAWKSALWQVNGTCLLFWSSANSRIGLRLGLVWVNAHTGCVKKRKLLILSEYVNKTEKTGGMWTNTNSYRENEILSVIFTWNIFYVTLVLRLNILSLKAVSEITARQTWTSFTKFICM